MAEDDPSSLMNEQPDSPIDEPSDLADGEEEDLSGLLESNESTGSGSTTPDTLQDKKLEFFATLNVNLLKLTTDLSETRNIKVFNSNTSMGFSAGIEKYFSGMFLLEKISLFGIFHMGTQESDFDTEMKSSVSFMEYGGGANFHFLGHPLAINRPIGFHKCKRRGR